MSYFSAFSNAGLSFVTKLGEIVAPLEDDEEGDDGLDAGSRVGAKIRDVDNNAFAEESRLRVVNHASPIASVACADVVDDDSRATSHIVRSEELHLQRYEPEEHPCEDELSPSLMVDIELHDIKPMHSTFSSNNFAGEFRSVSQVQKQEGNDHLKRQQLLLTQQCRSQQPQAIMQEDESDEGDEMDTETIQTKYPQHVANSQAHLSNSLTSTNGGRECAEVRQKIVPLSSSAVSSIPIHAANTNSLGAFTPIANDFLPYHSRSQVSPASFSSVGNINGNNLVETVKECNNLQAEVQQQVCQKQQVESILQKLPNSHQFRENSLEFRNQNDSNNNAYHVPSVQNHQKEIPKDGVPEQPFWNILERIEHTERCILQDDLQQEQQLSSFLTGKIGVNIHHLVAFSSI